MVHHFISRSCLILLLITAPLAAATTAEEVAKSVDATCGLVVVIGSGDALSAQIAAGLGSGDRLVHVIAANPAELAMINSAVAKAQLQGYVSAEVLGTAALPYRDAMVNVMVIADLDKAKAAGFTMAEANRCVVPEGKIIVCQQGKVAQVTTTPARQDMDVWTHRYHGADGVPESNDKAFGLPVGFKWNADLPMNFDNPVQGANRYSSTRALVVDDGRCFSFSSAVYENLGDGWTSDYGTDQYLTCRDAFNGRLLWRKRIGDTFYGGLYIENTAPLISTGRRLYLAGENDKMQVLDTRTGELVRELPTANIPGVIAASDGVVVVATWKDGKKMGAVKHYDRRRMDWEINEGTVEAYDDASGKLLWKNDVLGTSLLIADKTVFIVNRQEKDELEKEFNKRRGIELKHPPQKVIAMNLADGKTLWSVDDASFGASDQPLSLESAGHGAVAVGLDGRAKVAILSASDGKPLDGDALKEANKVFFRYRNHICTPTLRVGDVILNNRGGNISDGGKNTNFGGARAACLTGTVPAYGAGYIAQNWCRCSPGQISGLTAIASIGKEPTPAEMEAPVEPIAYSTYSDGVDGLAPASLWTSFRGNAERSSSAAWDVPATVDVAWSAHVTDKLRDGTVTNDWRSYLNSRLTAAVVAGDLAIVSDIDRNEIIAVNNNDGSIKWRYTTSGRVDTSPTVYKGICLIGDHTGYVSAIKVRTGELIYKLRIAPQEKRMLSYGKVESVWPVIGGVMIADGKAYASAGRTQGSDGGLVVRAFMPEDGKPLWAKALPQSGNGVIEKAPKRNDALARHGEYLTVMGHWLRLDTGAITAKPEGDTVVMGLEGLYSWNWTRLGNRKFISIGYGKLTGDTVSWNDQFAAATTHDSGGAIVSLADENKKQGFAGAARTYQATSLIICNNALIQGGALLDQQEDHGFIRAINLADGKVLWEKKYPTKLAFNGLAVDNRGIIASFDDGTVICLK